MLDKRKKVVIVAVLCMLTLLLAACGGSTSTSSGSNQGSGGATPAPTTMATANATVVTGGSTNARVTPPAGPNIITSPTPIAGTNGKGEQVTLKDRTVLIMSAVKQKGADPALISIVLTLTIKNTNAQTIQNQPQFFQLVGTEGDTFGKQSNSSDSFYGPINGNSQRSGVIVFEIPTAAASGLRLMYQPEVTSETSFIPLIF